MAKMLLKEDIPTRDLELGSKTARATITRYMFFRDF